MFSKALLLPYRGHNPIVHHTTYVADTACLVGDVRIGAESSVWFGCTLRGDVNEIRIGSGTNIQDGTVVHVAARTFGTYIGDNITIGHMALIHACTLESNCFIGMKACVMDGAVVEEGAMVAAGALVPPGKRVRKGELWAGVPARKLRDLTDEDYALFRDSAERYVALAATYMNARL